MDNVVGSGGGGWFLQIEQRKVTLREGEFTIGRSRGCGVVLRDPSVSRGHALLCVAAGKVTLQDLQSSNGTFVNGKRLEGEVSLAAGDRLVLGETELFLRWAGDGSAGATSEEARLFCPACGLPVARGESRCTSCGAVLSGTRLPHRSEAFALGEVLPVGEVLSAASGSWDATRFRRHATGLRPVPSPPPAPAAAHPAPADPVEQLPMSAREAERARAAAPRPTPVPVPSPPPPPAPPRGLLARLAARLRGRQE